MLEIKKNVPIPPSRGQGREPNFPEISMLEIGDSIFPPLNGEDGVEMQKRMYSACYGVTRKTGKRFLTRVFEDCIGVWRINDDGTLPGTEKAEPAPDPEGLQGSPDATQGPIQAAYRPPQPVLVGMHKAKGRKKVVVHVEKRA
jgi:hypothetical protein